MTEVDTGAADVDPHTESSGSGSSGIEQIEDPDNYLSRRRLKELYDAKEAVRERRRTIDLLIADPQFPRVTRGRAAEMYYSVVVDFLSTLEPLITIKHPEVGEEYWEEVDLGEVVISPPDQLSESTGPSPYNDFMRIIDPPTEVVRQFRGLESIMEEQYFSVDFEATIQTRSNPELHTETMSVTRPIPWSILTAAQRQGGLFLAEIGVEVELGDDENEAEFGYSDLI